MNLKEVIESGNFDLHVHTKASDGDYSPSEVVQLAKKVGLRTIAITDHDTLEGIESAQREGDKVGIQVISGVELSTKYKGKNIDVLGYNITAVLELQNKLQHMRDGRVDRAKRIIEKFNNIGYSISLEDVQKFSEDGVIARPHIAKAIVEKGYVSDYQTVFDQFLADGRPCAMDKLMLTPNEAIQLIHQAGGIAVLAHPLYIEDDDLVRELLKFGFDGIEVWHRSHHLKDIEKYQGIAREFGIIGTGGSDFHNDDHNLGVFGIEK